MNVIGIVSIGVTVISIIFTIVSLRKHKEKDASPTKLKASISFDIKINKE